MLVTYTGEGSILYVISIYYLIDSKKHLSKVIVVIACYSIFYSFIFGLSIYTKSDCHYWTLILSKKTLLNS